MNLKREYVFAAAVVSIVLMLPGFSAAQKQVTQALRLVRATNLPNFSGDFDHLEVDLAHQHLFLAAEDHHTIEVFDVRTGNRIRSLGPFGATHSALYLQDSNRLLITDASGFCRIFDGTSFREIKAIEVRPGADSIGYDQRNQRLFVVNGGRDANMPESYLSVIDLKTLEKVAELKLSSNHLESMALEDSGPRLWINVTDQNQVWVIDREKLKVVAKWSIPEAGENSPVAFDPSTHRLFIVCRKPPRLIVLESDTGKLVAALPTAGKSDAISFDAAAHRIYVPGGEGYVAVYKVADANTVELIENVPTAQGAKTALFVPELGSYYLAVSPGEGHFGAKLLAYHIESNLP